MQVGVIKIKCKRCGHEWSPRKTEIRMCPKCKSPYFDKAKELKGMIKRTKQAISKELDRQKR